MILIKKKNKLTSEEPVKLWDFFDSVFRKILLKFRLKSNPWMEKVIDDNFENRQGDIRKGDAWENLQ